MGYPSGSFDAASTILAIEKYGCTHMDAVPTMVPVLAGRSTQVGSESRYLKSISLAGSMVHAEIIKSCTDERSLGARHVSASYGMTEGSCVHAVDNSHLPFFLGSFPNRISVGTLTHRAKIRICSPRTRAVLQRGEAGKLHLGGAQVTRGYLRTTADTLYENHVDHWIVTGDMAVVDEGGRVFILGRYKDLVIRGGENISPVGIEYCLDSFTGITVSSYFGVSWERC